MWFSAMWTSLWQMPQYFSLNVTSVSLPLFRLMLIFSKLAFWFFLAQAAVVYMAEMKLSVIAGAPWPASLISRYPNIECTYTTNLILRSGAISLFWILHGKISSKLQTKCWIYWFVKITRWDMRCRSICTPCLLIIMMKPRPRPPLMFTFKLNNKL